MSSATDPTNIPDPDAPQGSGAGRSTADHGVAGFCTDHREDAARPTTVAEAVEVAYRAHLEARKGAPLAPGEFEATRSRVETKWMAAALEAGGYADLLAEVTPAPCVMTHTPPFDFAQCETHDETFPLGGACRFQGREAWEVYADEADEQRQRAVLAEIEVERLTEAADGSRSWADEQEDRAITAEATVARVEALADVWASDDAEHLATFGQHHPASLSTLELMLRTALHPKGTDDEH